MKTPSAGSALRPVIIGGFGPPTLACLRSWGRQGWSPGLIAVQNPGEGRPRSRYLRELACLPRSALYTEAGIRGVAAFLESFSASGLMCIDEQVALWLNAHRSRFPSDLLWWIPPTETINRVLSKTAQIEAASQAGLDVLPTYLFENGQQLPQVPSEHFPLCLRPSRPNSTRPVFKVCTVADQAEIKKYLLSLETLECPLIGQPFTNLPNLVVHGSRSASGETFGLTAFLVPRKFQGVTLTIKPFLLPAELRDKCLSVTEELGLIGNYHFEFLIEPRSGRTWFLEVNYRLGGTTAKVMACGYDEPAWAMNSLGIKARVFDKTKPVTASNKQALVRSLLGALRNELTPLDYPQEPVMLRLCHSLGGLVTCRDDIFCLDDLEGACSVYLESVKSKVRSCASRLLGERVST